MAEQQRTANKLRFENLSKNMPKSKFKDKFDPDGSYTGTPLDGDEPTQDVDDL